MRWEDGDGIGGLGDEVRGEKGMNAAEGDPVAGDGVGGDEVAEVSVRLQLKVCYGGGGTIYYRLAVATVLVGVSVVALS